jgi:triosephosphate isomerase
VRRALEGSHLALSAQNVYWEEKGAFTGEISPMMLADVGCRYCIVGHSERRASFGDTDEVVAKKIRALLAHPLSPILCVGESLAERDGGQAASKVTHQLEVALAGLSAEEIGRTVVAYEPIWAIGTGRNATPNQAEEIHVVVRSVLRLMAGDTADSVRILYGGSVKPENAAELLAQENVDGALVGGASLDPAGFAQIVRASVH